jgi:hypothetical protein
VSKTRETKTINFLMNQTFLQKTEERSGRNR